MHLEIIFKDPNRKKIFLSKTKTLCAVILSYHLLTWFTGCPFRFFFGISCPGCGMTRALLAALRLDFAAAFPTIRCFSCCRFSCWDIISIPGLTGAVTTFFSDL